jgi:hypothetical protein
MMVVLRPFWSTRHSVKHPTGNHPQRPFIQTTDHIPVLLQYCGSYPYARHDPYLPSIPAALQALGRVEYATTYAVAPPDSRTATPLILTLFSQRLLDACKQLTSERLHLSSHNRSDPARTHVT